MGFASKIAGSQPPNSSAPNMSKSGVYGGAPPSGYTGGPPPASLQPGGYNRPTPPAQGQQYQPYPGSPSPSAGQPGSTHSPYPSSPSPAQPYQPYNAPPVPPKPGPSPGPVSSPTYGGPPGSGLPPQGYPPSPYSPHPQTPQGYQQPPYGQPPQGYSRPAPPPPQQPYGAPPYPQQPYYGQAPYPQGPPQGPPQGSPYPGGPPQSGPPGNGPPPGGPPQAGAPATPQQVAAYRQLLISTIQERSLQSFYPPDKLDRLVQGLARDAPGKISKLTHEWSVPMEVATDVMKLALFDVILYVDDSGSIEFEEKGVRKEQLKQILSIVATAASTFDDDGISIRFMNSMELGDGIRDAEDVNRLVSRVRFSGLTPLGSGLRNKVLDPMVVGPARANRLQKPVLVITITDGQPAGEPHDTVANSIHYAVGELSRTPYGRGAVNFQFSQVGNDTRARDFLGSLDEDPTIGQLIDCTSNFEVEQDEMSRANPPVYLTRELWCAKLMLGAIDSSYDTKDEKAAGAGGAGGPPGGPPLGGPGPAGAPSGPPGYGGGYSQAPSYSQPGYYSQPPAPSYSQPGAYGSPSPAPAPYGQAPYPPSQGRPPQAYGGYGTPPPGAQGAPRGYPPQGGYYQPPGPPRY